MTNTERHTFSFDGGEMLTSIGATFFVSYLYHKYVDSSHNNWASIQTQRSRINTINRSEMYHQFWLKQIDNMKEVNLNRNSLGLDGITVKKMACQIRQVL